MSEDRMIRLQSKEQPAAPPKKEKISLKRRLLFLFLLVLVPLTILVGWRYFDRKYYITSLLIIVYAMLPFFFMFEKRLPKAREVVMLAVMIGICVMSRVVFIWLPHFKPMAAIIILTGVAFGAEAGFLTGAMSAFVSNFLFGQGPWTPWQMFAFGLIGFLAGLLHQRGILKKTRLSLCVFGGLGIMLLVGPLLDTAAVFTMLSVLSKEGILATYLSGLPINAIHALATVLTLFFLSQPLLEKLDRVKIKYAMMEGV